MVSCRTCRYVLVTKRHVLDGIGIDDGVYLFVVVFAHAMPVHATINADIFLCFEKTLGTHNPKMWRSPVEQVPRRDDNTMDTKLSTIQRNLSSLEALKDHGKLRVHRLDAPLESGVKEEPSHASEPSESINIGTHHLAVDDRWMLQGVRRTISGDGHKLTIAFVWHLVDEIEALANRAFAQYNSGPERPPEKDGSDMFARKALEVLQSLATSILAANKGLIRLKHTTYAENEQIGVELSNLTLTMDRIASRINQFLLNPNAADAPDGRARTVTNWPPPL